MASMAHYRGLAISAARAEMRRQGENPIHQDAKAALSILDDLSRTEPNLAASFWYAEATDNQIALFKQDWRRYRRQWT